MKIKEFSIFHYGPLLESARISLGDFNLIYGKNEAGKTLTIDALVKFLFGRKLRTRDFQGMERVEERPDGYVVIEKDDGSQIKLPERGTLEDITGLGPTDYRNIFIIRDSSLVIEKEGEFYGDVTDKLTGLRTQEIYTIKENLRRIGRITPGGIFIDTKEDKLKTQLEQAKGLIEKIDVLLSQAQVEGFDVFEIQLADFVEQRDSLIHESEVFEEARKRERYERGEQSLIRLRECLQKVEELRIYSHEDEELWRDYEKARERIAREKGNVFTELNLKEKELGETGKELNRMQKEFHLLEERKRGIDDEIRPELKSYEIKKTALAGEKSKLQLYMSSGILSVLLLFVSLVTTLFNHSPVFYFLVILFLILSGIAFIYIFRYMQLRAWIAQSLTRLTLSLSKFGMNAGDNDEILFSLRKFKEEYLEAAEDLKRKEVEMASLKRDTEKLRERDKKYDGELKEGDERIEGVRKRTGIGSLLEYAQMLALKQGYENSLREQKKALESLFGAQSGVFEENLIVWEKEVNGLELYKGLGKDIHYSEQDIQKLKETESSCTKKIRELDERMQLYKENLRDIELKVNVLLKTESDAGYLHCKTTAELAAVKEKLSLLIHKREFLRDIVLKDIGIFEEIEREEKGRIQELFGQDSAVSEFFGSITNGLYQEVFFNHDLEKILVRRQDGMILEAEKLSGGAYDQLYLSIRVALGEKLLKGEKGFFIMDDPFIKSDMERLRNQFKMLEEVSDSGWQVIYFSAKEEVWTLLNAKGKMKNEKCKIIWLTH